jgi:hypothetical protein
MYEDVVVPEWVLVSACRYALGRSSYVAPETVGLLVERWGVVSAEVRGVIVRDVEEFVRGRSVEDFDVGIWVRFLEDVGAVKRG